MRQKLASLTRFTFISSVALTIATVSNFLNHHKYWNGTIFAVQTVDFNILSHSLPTKLSIILEQGKKAEIQRTLDSNYGLFGLVVTDCKTIDVKCTNQKVLYSSKSKFRWQQRIQLRNLSSYPYDNLRNPPPVYAEGYFANTRDRQRLPTNRTNPGTIIGRVYYIRNTPPTFIQDYTRWLQNLSSLSGARATYTLTVALFLFAGIAAWAILEQVLYRKRVEQESMQRERQQLLKKQQQQVLQAQLLQQQLQDKLQQIHVLLKQRQQDRRELVNYQALQAQQIQHLESAIARYEAQLTSQEAQQHGKTQKLEQLQQELIVFQEREVVTLAQFQQREQNVASLEQQINQQKLEQQQKSARLAALREELEEAKRRESAAQHQADSLKQTINVLTYEQEQTARNFEELEHSLAERASVEDLTTTLESAKTELNNAKKFEELALEDNQKLSEELKQLRSENDEAQLQVWDLQEQVLYYQDYFTKAAPQHQKVAVLEQYIHQTAFQGNIELSTLHLALVGGHPSVRREVIRELTVNYGLIHYVEIAPSNEAYIDRSSIKAKVNSCNLIGVITGYIGHDLSGIVSDLQKNGAIDGELLWINYRGKSGIVRSLLQHIQSETSPAMAMK